MRLIIAGSRSVKGPKGLEYVRKAIKDSGWTPTEIISGDAEGVDKLAQEIAEDDHIDLVIIPANWALYGKSAGYKRNQKMAWYAQLFKDSEEDKLKGGLVAVWDGSSSGTKHMIDIAREKDLPTFVLTVPPDFNQSA